MLIRDSSPTKDRFFSTPSPGRNRRETNIHALPLQHLAPSSTRPSPRIAVLVAGVSFLVVTLACFLDPHSPLGAPSAADAVQHFTQATGDDRDPSLPRFRIAEVRKHDAKSQNPWVIQNDKVYDITDWIPAHPGGQVILRAAGGSIDPYWDIFTVHKNHYVQDILSNYLIGFVDQADLIDGKPALEQIQDPFVTDPERHAELITRTEKPRNAETPANALASDFLTPNELFYIRNHMWVPRVGQSDSDSHLLTVQLLDGTVKQYTLQELKSRLPCKMVTATLQCSGNRRKHMNEESGRPTNGLPWTVGAVSNALWEGVPLADVLADAGLQFTKTNGKYDFGGVKHVQFSGLEAYGASIPIKKAIDPEGDVLLAYSMNGKPLPPDHGFPLRAIIPGHVAARSVKWLSEITLSEEESQSQWQRRDYKCFGPNETNVDWESAPAIQELPVQSAITKLKLGGWTCTEERKEGSDDSDPSIEGPAQRISLDGYALSGGGRAIIRVDISLDSGNTWAQAQLVPDCNSADEAVSLCQGNGAWAWKRWRFEGAIPMRAFQHQAQARKGTGNGESVEGSQNLAPGNVCGSGGNSRRLCTVVLAKAIDDAYNTQPETHAATWNIRGNLANAWHRIQVCTNLPSKDCLPKKINSRGVDTGT